MADVPEWLRRLLGRPSGERTVFVVCVKGVPVGVCASDDDVRASIHGRTPRDVRIFRVPFTQWQT